MDLATLWEHNMTRRKTVTIRELIDDVNGRNERSTCGYEVRQGWNSLLEKTLMNANVYAGFGFLTTNMMTWANAEMEAANIRNAMGYPPGIIYGKNNVGVTDPDAPAENVYPDETRRFYYYHRIISRS